MKCLTIHYPWCYLWLMDIKVNETRPRGIRCNVPTKLIIHSAKKKPDAAALALADKYLGKDFKPSYGHLIGICTLNKTTKITPELIKSQTKQELELGFWEPGRVAWHATDKKLFNLPIAATGKQAAPWNLSQELIPIVEQELYLMNLQSNDNLIASKTETSYEQLYVISWKNKGNPINTYKHIPEHIGKLDQLRKQCEHIESLGLKPCFRNCNDFNYKHYQNLKPHTVDYPFPWVIDNYWNSPDKWHEISKESFEYYSFEWVFDDSDDKQFLCTEPVLEDKNKSVYLA